MTLDQVGDVIGLTRERIRQIEARAMNRLKGSREVRFKLEDYLEDRAM